MACSMFKSDVIEQDINNLLKQINPLDEYLVFGFIREHSLQFNDIIIPKEIANCCSIFIFEFVDITFYQLLFKSIDTENTGILNGDEIYSLFRSSVLHKNILSDIWNETVKTKLTNALSQQQFINAMRLISFAQTMYGSIKLDNIKCLNLAIPNLKYPETLIVPPRLLTISKEETVNITKTKSHPIIESAPSDSMMIELLKIIPFELAFDSNKGKGLEIHYLFKRDNNNNNPIMIIQCTNYGNNAIISMEIYFDKNNYLGIEALNNILPLIDNIETGQQQTIELQLKLNELSIEEIALNFKVNVEITSIRENMDKLGIRIDFVVQIPGHILFDNINNKIINNKNEFLNEWKSISESIQKTKYVQCPDKTIVVLKEIFIQNSFKYIAQRIVPNTGISLYFCTTLKNIAILLELSIAERYQCRIVTRSKNEYLSNIVCDATALLIKGSFNASSVSLIIVDLEYNYIHNDDDDDIDINVGFQRKDNMAMMIIQFVNNGNNKSINNIELRRNDLKIETLPCLPLTVYIKSGDSKIMEIALFLSKDSMKSEENKTDFKIQITAILIEEENRKKKKQIFVTFLIPLQIFFDIEDDAIIEREEYLTEWRSISDDNKEILFGRCKKQNIFGRIDVMQILLINGFIFIAERNIKSRGISLYFSTTLKTVAILLEVCIANNGQLRLTTKSKNKYLANIICKTAISLINHQ